MEDLVYQRELWSKRATIARECGEELGELAKALVYVVERNYFGAGCIEGEAVFAGLRALIDSGSSSLVRIADDSMSLSVRSDAAMNHLSEADLAGADVVGGK